MVETKFAQIIIILFQRSRGNIDEIEVYAKRNYDKLIVR